MKPILSICIPTLNRSALLEVLLKNLENEATAHLDRIEIVVANNASIDTTEATVMRSPLPITYGKQTSTVGFARNVLFATAGLASGDFVWVVGDDDLILAGGITRVLESIQNAPDVDYHYLNFGWIDHQLRAQIIHETHGQPPPSLLNRLQFIDTQWRKLYRLEDLIFLPSDNVSAAFSGIFCFVTRRHFFVDAVKTLKPSDSLDGSSTVIADCFPHAMLSLPRVAGSPIAYIGKPCLMQGTSAWEWGGYAYKNMIFGTHQFFEWLEQTNFAEDAMQELWRSFFQMAGRLFFRMLNSKEEHKGLEIVLERAIPEATKNTIFWDSFMEEARKEIEVEYEARNLSERVEEIVTKNPNTRIGLWGVLGRGQLFVKKTPHLLKNLVWIADKDSAQHGWCMDGTNLPIMAIESLEDANLDLLVIGARKDFVDEITNIAKKSLKSGSVIVSVKGQINV